MIGFTAPAWRRSTVAVAYAVLVVIACWWIEQDPAKDPARSLAVAAPGATAPVHQVPLTIESTAVVGQWNVTVAGDPVAAEHTAPHAWYGQVPWAIGSELLIRAQPPVPTSEPVALRIRLDGRETVRFGAWPMVVSLRPPATAGRRP